MLLDKIPVNKNKFLSDCSYEVHRRLREQGPVQKFVKVIENKRNCYLQTPGEVYSIFNSMCLGKEFEKDP